MCDVNVSLCGQSDECAYLFCQISTYICAMSYECVQLRFSDKGKHLSYAGVPTSPLFDSTPLTSHLDIVTEEESLWSLSFYQDLCLLDSIAKNGSVGEQHTVHTVLFMQLRNIELIHLPVPPRLPSPAFL